MKKLTIPFRSQSKCPVLTVAGGNAGSLERVTQFFSGAVVPAQQRFSQRRVAPLEDGMVEFQLAIHVSIGRMDARRGEGEQPRMSSGATKCQVGRNKCVRRIEPSLNACSMSLSATPRKRSPSDHFAPR